MVTESEIANMVRNILEGSDLKRTTNNIVIKKLESEFGIDLSDRKPFLRNQVDRFLQSQYNYFEDDDHCVIDREIGGNDDVFDSDDGDGDDDEFYNAVPEMCSTIRINCNNGIDTKLKRIDKSDRSARQKKEKRTCLSGKFCTLSPKLQMFLGVPHMTRAEIIKQLWIYVKEKSLQDPNDGKSIICDETLRDLLGVDSINILQIHKALTKHIWPRAVSVKPPRRDKELKEEKEGESEEVQSAPGDKPRRHEREEDPCGDEMNQKRPKKVLSGFLAPLPLSNTLVRFLGTGEIALTRADVIKRVWEYIKHKKLQDPSDKKIIICDENLKALLNVDSFHGFTVSKLLSPHFVKL